MLDNIRNTKISYEPYKYIMQDTGSLYIGAKYSFKELLDNELVGFKMKAIISHYILKEADVETSLESQFYYMEKSSFVYDTFYQLKAKVKVLEVVEKKNIFGKKKVQYVEKIYSIEDFTDINLAKKKGAGIVITEIIISKLALMSFSV